MTRRVITIAVASILGVLLGYYTGVQVSHSLKFGLGDRAEFAPASGVILKKSLLTHSITNENASSRIVGEPDLPEDLVRMGITREDMEKSIELQQRNENGDYMLKYEGPATKKRMEHDLREIAQNEKENRSAKHDKIFGELDIESHTAEQLKDQVAKIHRASLEAEVAMGQLLHARYDYDQRLHQIMDDKAYNRYREFEQSRHAERELESIRTYFSENGTTLGPQQGELLQSLIHVTQAYTGVSWHGPFDGLPDPKLGRDAVLSGLLEETARVQDSSKQLMEQVAQNNVSPETAALLAKYYVEQVDKKRALIDKLSQ